MAPKRTSDSHVNPVIHPMVISENQRKLRANENKSRSHPEKKIREEEHGNREEDPVEHRPVLRPKWPVGCGFG